MENPRFGGNLSANYSHSQKQVLAPVKIFKCKYCARIFLNSRALGGHQNAHKRERTLWITTSTSTDVLDVQKSLGMESHAIVRHNLITDNESTAEKANVSFDRFQQVVDHPHQGLKWRETSNAHFTISDHSENCTLDLDLHL